MNRCATDTDESMFCLTARTGTETTKPHSDIEAGAATEAAQRHGSAAHHEAPIPASGPNECWRSESQQNRSGRWFAQANRHEARCAQCELVRQPSQFVDQALALGAHANRVRIDFSRPGRPTDSAIMDPLKNCRLDECLNSRALVMNGSKSPGR